MKYKRLLNLNQVIKEKSAFLFGARATGKSWLIDNDLKNNAVIFDLLDSDLYLRLMMRPKQLAEEIGDNKLVVIDEVQKLPQILDEVQNLIDKENKIFLLSGSSARKLKRGGANLLAGRARSYSLFPLTSLELSNFDLLRYINVGGLPLVYNSTDYWNDLKDYTNLYIKEEVQAEALIRRVDHFARFLDVFGLFSGTEINIASIARDSGVPPRTVDGFIEVLKDTLLAFELLPFQKTKKRKASSKVKLYLFDLGVANYLSGRKEILPKTQAFGEAFEHFLIQEIRTLIGYKRNYDTLYYWRSDDYEVDLIIDDKIAIEIKSTTKVNDMDLKGLKVLREEGLIKDYYLLSLDPIKRKIDGIKIWPYDDFLKLIKN